MSSLTIRSRLVLIRPDISLHNRPVLLMGFSLEHLMHCACLSPDVCTGEERSGLLVPPNGSKQVLQ